MKNIQEKESDPNDILNYSFSDLVDIPDLQQLINHLSELTGCAIGILDVDNNFLVSAGLQKICTCFHRIHPETNNHCSESDCFIKENLKTKSPIEYKCKNGLWDFAYPIFIEEKHAANIFLGQFFFDDEAIDTSYFERQAQKYGFDKTEYLNALHEVPILSRKKINSLKHFNTALAQHLTKTGYSNLLLKKERVLEIRKANQQLKESELKFRTVFEQAGVGVVQIESSTGRFLKINNKFADMLGYSINELLQLNFKSITHPDDLDGNMDQMNRLIKKQITEFSLEKRYIRKDGTILWTILTVNGLSQAAGGELNNIGIAQDITERKKSEQNLLESELKFRTVFEQAGVGVAQVEATTGRFLKINKKFADMLGYSIDEMLQLTFQSITHPDDLKGNLLQQKKLLKKQITEFSAEKRYIRKDGTILWAILNVSNMKEMAGDNEYHIAVAQDITEHKKSEQALLESELKFRKLFEQAGVGVAQVESSTNRIVKINKKFADILGYTVNEMMQLTFRDFTHPDDVEESLHFKDTLNNKKNKEFSTEKRYIRKDETIVWVRLTTTAMWEVEEGDRYHISIVQDITENKKAEQDLKESEYKFRKLFELAGVGVAQVDIYTGRFVKVNKKLAGMLGYTIDEMLQLTFKQITYPEDLISSLQNQNRLLKKQIGDFSIEKRYVRKDGTTVWAILSASSMGKIAGGENFQIAVVQDITERKKSERDLKENEEKFKSIFYQSPIGLELYDINGKLLDCNPACLSMFGIDNINEVIGFNLFEDPNLTEQQKREIKEGKNVHFEIKFDFDVVKKLNLYNTSKSGQLFFSCLATAFKIDGYDKMGILLHLIDITENKRAEQILKEENERFHTTMNAIDSIVYVSDLENHEILFVNKFVTNLFGDITGKKCYSALQGKAAPCDFCTNHKLVDANGNVNQPHIWEFQNLITRNWYQCHDQAIRWANGNLVRFEIATDITKNIENELALKKNEKVLQQNEIKLSELNSAKDKFFSIIGHDLKNPFAVLKSSSELLSRYLEKNDLLKSKAKAEMISRASKNGYAILDNLLAWAKSQSGGIKFEPQILNFKIKVDKSITEVESQAHQKNIIITNEIPDDLLIEADENLLSVVFRNLLSNAIKFSHDGGIVTVTAKTGNSAVEIAVIDTGIGIPKEHQYKLFRLDINFSRVGTANESSTSLGLILCKEFIEKHKGKIWVESDEGKGSEFRFTLPNIQLENNPSVYPD